MTLHPPFGRAMRDAHFLFAPSYTPLNHGSFGAFPLPVQTTQTAYTSLSHARPDTFIVSDLPKYINASRVALSPLLGCYTDEIVLIPNATTGINTVLRNIPFVENDVVIYFSTIYDACLKTLASIGETSPVKGYEVKLEFPISEDAIVERMRRGIEKVRQKGGRVRMAMYDTVLTFPGVRMPWEGLVEMCREEGVLSLIDGAHGIGHIDLTHLGKVQPDFFVSNCHKWLYTPRGCAVFYVPFKNQHLIHSSLPTSHGYAYQSSSSPFQPEPNQFSPAKAKVSSPKSNFTHLFEFVATIDYTPYLCIPSALAFRKNVCGGEDKTRGYCYDLAKTGGAAVADVLGTHVLTNPDASMDQVYFTNVALPLKFTPSQPEREGEAKRNGIWGKEKIFDVSKAGAIGVWLNRTAVERYDTYLQIAFHSGFLWVRLSAQIYLELGDFEWVAGKLEVLCKDVREGEVVF